jgi:hypothetical protein
VATSLELQTDDADSIVERAMDYVVYAAMEALAEGDEYYDALEFAGQTAIDQTLELLDEDHIETEAGKSIVSYGDPRPGRGRSRPFGGARRYTSPDYIHRDRSSGRDTLQRPIAPFPLEDWEGRPLPSRAAVMLGAKTHRPLLTWCALSVFRSVV